MKIFTRYAVTVLGSLALFSGCGKDEEEKADNSSLLSIASLQGTWRGACKSVAGAYGRTTYTFTDTTFTFSSEAFEDKDCAKLADSIVVRGTFGLPGDTYVDDTTLAMIDYDLVSASWSFVTAPSRAVDWSKLCGNATVVNNQLDLLGKTCKSGTYSLMFAAETFGSIHVDGTAIVPTDVTAGAATAETRATSVDKVYGKLEKLEVVAAAAP